MSTCFFVTLSLLAKLLDFSLRICGMKIAIVNPNTGKEEELAIKFYKLRDDIFAKKHHWEEPRGQERDRYDSASQFILVIKRGCVVAGCRIIHKELLGGPLPFEKDGGLQGQEDASVGLRSIEVSRMINTTRTALVSLVLHLSVYVYAKKGNYEGVFAVIRESYLISLERRFGKKYFHRFSGCMQKGNFKFIPVRIAL
jgi:N-acyl-L-homoserine lactone synthetase